MAQALQRSTPRENVAEEQLRSKRRRGDEPAKTPDNKPVHREATLQTETVRKERPHSIQIVAGLKPDARARWLSIALGSVASGNVRPSDVYDIVAHPRFASDISCHLAFKMMQDIRSKVDLFPSKIRQSILEGSFELGQKASLSRTSEVAKFPDKSNATSDVSAEEMLARCVAFVRGNEAAISEAHELDARTFHVKLQRSSLGEAWGLSWSRALFKAQRRILEGIVPNSVASAWNDKQAELSGRSLRSGDELVAVGGQRGWDALGSIKDLLVAELTFISKTLEDEKKPLVNTTQAEPATQIPSPPAFAFGGYSIDSSGSGWAGHSGGEWLYSSTDHVYFHLPTKCLFMEDPSSSGTFIPLFGEKPFGALGQGIKEQSAEEVVVLHGLVRQYSKVKGRGLIAPWLDFPNPFPIKDGDLPSADIILHESELLVDGMKSWDMPPIVTRGTPVRFEPLLMEDGAVCATNVYVISDIASLCFTGSSVGPSSRCVDKSVVELKGLHGQACTAAVTNVISSRRGAGGAEYISVHFARHLAAAFHGREHCDEKQARKALEVALRQAQNGFLDYARRLDHNSAKLWLAAETHSCVALVFDTEYDGYPRVVLAKVGGGRGLVVRRDGSVSSRLGGRENACVNTSRKEVKSGDSKKQDPMKLFEQGLKGPDIAFPTVRSMIGQAEPMHKRGFGAHAWDEKDGGAAGLDIELHSATLNWEEDALLIIASDCVWEGLNKAGKAGDEKAARIALCAIQSVRKSGASERFAAERVMEAACLGPRHLEDGVVAVMRFAWCSITYSCGDPAAGAPQVATAPFSVSTKASADECPRQRSEDFDIFAHGVLAAPLLPAATARLHDEPESDRMEENESDEVDKHENTVEVGRDSNLIPTALASTGQLVTRAGIASAETTSERRSAEVQAVDSGPASALVRTGVESKAIEALDDAFAAFLAEVA